MRSSSGLAGNRSFRWKGGLKFFAKSFDVKNLYASNGLKTFPKFFCE